MPINIRFNLGGKIYKILIIYLSLILTFSIYGVYLTNNGKSNLVTLLFILITSVSPIFFITQKKYLEKETIFAIAIYIIALSLLYHISLVGPYINGSDIHTEYFHANRVLQDNFWNIKIFHTINSMINVVIFLPLLSIVLGVELTTIFKLIVPLIFSVVPVLLFYIYKKEFSLEISFLSSILFIFIPTFFYNMPTHSRVEIAELFLALVLFLMINFEKLSIKIKSLLLLFSFSVIVSHYGLSVLYLLMLIPFLLVLYFPKRKNFITNLTLNYIGLFIVVLISWYMYTSSSTLFNSLVRIGDSIADAVLNDFLQPYTRDVITLSAREELSFVRTITKWLNIFVIFSIGIGYLQILNTKLKMYYKNDIYNQEKHQEDFFILSSSAILLILFSIIIPTFSQRLNFWRLYQMMLIFLAPSGIIGIKFLFDKINIRANSIPIFLCMFLLFNAGFMSEILTDEAPFNIALNKATPSSTYIYIEEFDLTGALWLRKNTFNGNPTYFGSTDRGKYLVSGLFGKGRTFDWQTTDIPYLNSYFLITNNELQYNRLKPSSEKEEFDPKIFFNSIFYNYLYTHTSKIYDSGGFNVWISS